MNDDPLARGRAFLKDAVRQTIDFSTTDQARQIPPPPFNKPYPPDAVQVRLPDRSAWSRIAAVDLVNAIAKRRSRRRYKPDALHLDELAFLLWATQGIRKVATPAVTFRNVPSAGARHALETYVCALDVDTLEPGVYRYLPREHGLLRVSAETGLPARLTEAALGQGFAGQAAATFVWTAVPYRMEWRYSLAAHKVIALDAGHVCQNLYLACEAIGAGTCAIAAYDQDRMDRLLGVDGEDEFAVYLAPVGRV